MTRGASHVAAGNVVAGCCAASGGIHAALVPEHLGESTVLGIGFALSAVALFAAALAFTRPQQPPFLEPAAVALLLGLMAAYVVSRTIGLPLPGTEVERFDAVGLATGVIQICAVAALIRRKEAPCELLTTS